MIWLRARPANMPRWLSRMLSQVPQCERVARAGGWADVALWPVARTMIIRTIGEISLQRWRGHQHRPRGALYGTSDV